MRKKVSQTEKTWYSNPSFCLADLKKSSKKLAEATLVWQLVEASL